MKISKVSARNLKNRSFAYGDFGEITIVCGDNFSGKTCVIEAIRLAISGYSPETARTNQGVWEFAGYDDRLWVEVGLDTGEVIRREWHKEGDTIHHNGPETRRIPSLDPAIYFGLSGNKQVEYLSSHMSGSIEFDAAAAMIALIEEINPDNEQQEKDLMDLKENAQAILKSRHPVSGLEALREKLQVAIKFAEEKVRIESAKSAGDPGDIEAAQKEADEERLRVDELEKQVDSLSREISRAWAMREHCALEEKRRERMKIDFEQESGVEDEIDRLRQEISRVEKQAPHDEQDAIAESETRYAEFTAESKKEETKAILERDIQEAENLDKCPYCGSSDKGWKDRLIKELEEQKALIGEPRVEEARAAWRAAQKKLNLIQESNMEIRDGNSKRDMALARLKEMESVRERAKARAEQMQAILSSPLPEAKMADEIIAMEKALEEVRAKLDQARKDHTRASQGIVDARRGIESRLLEEREKARAKIARRALKAVSRTQSEVCGILVGKLLETANLIVAPVTGRALVYHNGELGLDNGKTIATQRTMSGSERAVVFAAVSAALSAKSDFPVLILDELSRLTPNRRSDLIKALDNAISGGALDQAILVIPGARPAGLDDDVRVIHVD